MKETTHLFGLVTIVASVCLNTGPAAAARAEEAKYGGTFRLSARKPASRGWGGTLNSGGSDNAVMQGPLQGNGNLVRPCRENIYLVCPGLAESWKVSDDFTQFTFKLRDNIQWHDGTPLTPEQVKWWAELAFYGTKVGEKERPRGHFYSAFGDLQKVEALDGNRVRFTMGSPLPTFLSQMYLARTRLNDPQHLIQPLLDEGDLLATPKDIKGIALGPFKLDKFRKGIGFELSRFDGYWEKDEKGRQLPYLDGVLVAFIGDAHAMDAAFRVGRLDGTARAGGHYLTPDRKTPIERDLGDKVWFGEIGGPRSSLAFNTLTEGPWQDARVRKAMQLWIDKQEAIRVVIGFGDLFTILHSQSPWITPGFQKWPGWNPQTKEADRAEARRLMAEAGYAGGFEMEIMCKRTHVPRCEFLQGQLTPLGIDLKLDVVDSATNNTRGRGLGWHVRLGGASYTYIPEDLELQMASFSKDVAANAKFEDRKMDELFERLKRARSVEERIQINQEVEKLTLLDQAYMIPLFGTRAVIAYRSYVKGLIPAPDGIENNNTWATVWLDK